MLFSGNRWRERQGNIFAAVPYLTEKIGTDTTDVGITSTTATWPSIAGCNLWLILFAIDIFSTTVNMRSSIIGFNSFNIIWNVDVDGIKWKMNRKRLTYFSAFTNFESSCTVSGKNVSSREPIYGNQHQRVSLILKRWQSNRRFFRSRSVCIRREKFHSYFHFVIVRVRRRNGHSFDPFSSTNIVCDSSREFKFLVENRFN